MPGPPPPPQGSATAHAPPAPAAAPPQQQQDAQKGGDAPQRQQQQKQGNGSKPTYPADAAAAGAAFPLRTAGFCPLVPEGSPPAYKPTSPALCFQV